MKSSVKKKKYLQGVLITTCNRRVIETVVGTVGVGAAALTATHSLRLPTCLRGSVGPVQQIRIQVRLRIRTNKLIKKMKNN